MASTPLNPQISLIKRSLHLSPVLVIGGLMAGPAIAQSETAAPENPTEPLAPQDTATHPPPQPQVTVSAEPATVAATTRPNAAPQPQFSQAGGAAAAASIPASISYSAADLAPLPEPRPPTPTLPTAQISAQPPTVSNIAPPTTQRAPQMSSGSDQSPELQAPPSNPTPQLSQVNPTPNEAVTSSGIPQVPRSSLTFSGPRLTIPTSPNEATTPSGEHQPPRPSLTFSGPRLTIPTSPNEATTPSGEHQPPRPSLTFSGPRLTIPNASDLPEGAVPTVRIDHPETQEDSPSLTEALVESSPNNSPPSTDLTEASPCPEILGSELSGSGIQDEIYVAAFSFRRYTGSSSDTDSQSQCDVQPQANTQSEPLIFSQTELENILLPEEARRLRQDRREARGTGESEASEEKECLIEPENPDEQNRYRTIGDVQNQFFSPVALNEIANTVAQFYSCKGYTTSGAVVNVLEPTSPEPQSVYIEVIESVLEYIDILPMPPDPPPDADVSASQQDVLRLERYVRQRLGLRENQPINTTQLQEAVILLSLDPLIDNITAEVSDGSGTGFNRLTVWVEEANPFDFAVGFDNAGAPSIGSFQRGINVSYGNVLGWGDRLAANYLNTDGSHELGFNYILPITPQNGTLGLRFNTKTSGIIEAPFDDLDGNGSGPDIQSDSQTYEVSLRQPIVRSVGPQPFNTAADLTYTEIALGLTLSVRDSGTQILGVPIGLSDDGRTHTTAVRFFQDWTRQNSRSAFGLRSQFNLGINAFGASIVKPVQQPGVILGALPDSQFFSWQGLAQWNYVLNPEIRSRYPLVQDQVLVLRGGVQLADRPLLPDEQFELGGVGTVRGYRKSALQTDNGFSASAEALFVVMTVPDVWPSLFPEADGVLQVIPFIDFGMGWDNAARVNPESGTLAAVGLGLQWQMGDLVARLDYGIPLISASERSTGNTWQENGVSFSISYSPSF